ncbi:MAG: DUF2892 domain-containing protein [Chitinophagaceae bacterium]|nr:DUF2892 domain-containing protein [Chitinophagaceae bacterium]
MKPNIGSADKMIRIALAITIAVLYFTKVISGTPGIILLATGAVLLLTALVNFCPIWAMLGISTKSPKNKKEV